MTSPPPEWQGAVTPSTRPRPKWDVPATAVMLALSGVVAMWCVIGASLVGMSMRMEYLTAHPNMGMTAAYVIMFVSVGVIVTGDVLGIVALARGRRAFWYPTVGIVVGFAAGFGLSEAAALL